MAPTAKFRSNNNNGDISAGGVAGLSNGVSITVRINTNANFTIPAISLRLKIGANLTNPSKRANTIKPAENQWLNCGKSIEICCIRLSKG